MPNDVVALRQAASTALANNDPAAANRAYHQELAVLSGKSAEVVEVARPAAPPPAPANTELLDHAFSAMAWWDDGESRTRSNDLRAKWGGDAPRNLQFAEAFASAHPDVRELINRNGLHDHPTIVEIAAILGRHYATVPGDSGRITTARETPVMDSKGETEFEDALAAKRAQIAEAAARGNTSRASRLYQEEMEMITARRGNSPIVGGRGRPG
jgi:hypothetical protein